MPLIAQLTDLHVLQGGALAYGRVDTLAHLRRAVDHLNGLPLNGILVTGDLIDDGRAESSATLRPELDLLTAPWWPLPGNHDGPALWEDFADRMKAAEPGPGHVVRLPGLTVATLDDTIPDADSGRLDMARAAWIVRAPEGGGPTLLDLHHPPMVTGIAHMERIGFDGTDRLADIVATHPPSAILAGHIHRTILGRLGTVPVVVAPSAAHAVTLDLDQQAGGTFTMEPPGVLLHDIGVHGLRTHISPIGTHPGPYPFAGFDPGI